MMESQMPTACVGYYCFTCSILFYSLTISSLLITVYSRNIYFYSKNKFCWSFSPFWFCCFFISHLFHILLSSYCALFSSCHLRLYSFNIDTLCLFYFHIKTGSSSSFLKKERYGLLNLALIFFLLLKTRSRNISLIRKRFKENNSTSTLTH